MILRPAPTTSPVGEAMPTQCTQNERLVRTPQLGLGIAFEYSWSATTERPIVKPTNTSNRAAWYCVLF